MADIGALDNVGKLPFIWAVACNTGEFNHGTSFGEAWLRATRDGAPIGAIGAYMSSISQSWDPPMAAQDEADRLLTQESYFTYGGLSFAGSEEMIDEYGDEVAESAIGDAEADGEGIEKIALLLHRNRGRLPDLAQLAALLKRSDQCAELLDGLGGVQLGVGNGIGQGAGITDGSLCH